MRVCNEPGCPELTTTPRCHTHTRQRDQQQGTRQQRGYDKAHDKLRKTWAPKVAGGKVNCWRCGQRISPLEPWDLGHDDLDRGTYRGPEHRACNRGKRPRKTDIAPGG